MEYYGYPDPTLIRHCSARVVIDATVHTSNQLKYMYFFKVSQILLICESRELSEFSVLAQYLCAVVI